MAINILKKYKKEGRRIIAVGTTALRALETGKQKGYTNIFIYPLYQFKVVDSLITKYKEAIKERYRFFPLAMPCL